MTRILVLGGYGVFGRRAAERLARVPALEVVIAGRNEATAREAAAQIAIGAKSRVSHAAIDATSLTADDLRRLGIDIVINTVGPFQAHDYRVAKAAIAARAHYIDIADARGFVTGIGSLDQAAKEAGVLVVSGASSVPALAAAVIDHHRPKFTSLTHLTYGISPGNSFDPGVATTASILGGVGRPFTTLIDGRMASVRGWQPLASHTFENTAVGTRWLGACDVPDLDLFPARYPDLVEQRFVAGVEVKAFHFGLWGLSWLVRAGLVRRPERLAAPMLGVKRHLGFLGSDRGAMFVSLAGRDRETRALRQTWELIAGEGHGPNIPATPVVIIARKLGSGELTVRGATPCVGLMTLAEFNAEVADLAITTTTREQRPLYREVLGADFEALPPRVRQLHELAGRSVWRGEADVEIGTSPLARLIAWIARLPRTGRAQPLTVTFTFDGRRELWHRQFGATVFPSRQSNGGNGVVFEQVGLARLALRPRADAEGLTLSLEGIRILGIPVPRLLLPEVATRESAVDGRYHFDVTCTLKGIGRLVRYTGWLEQVPIERAVTSPPNPISLHRISGQ